MLKNLLWFDKIPFNSVSSPSSQWPQTYFVIIIIFSHSLLQLPQFTNFRTNHFSQLIKGNKLNRIAGKTENAYEVRSCGVQGKAKHTKISHIRHVVRCALALVVRQEDALLLQGKITKSLWNLIKLPLRLPQLVWTEENETINTFFKFNST